MWAAIFSSVILAAAAGTVYLISRFYKFRLFEKLSGEKRILRVLWGFAAVILLAVLTGALMGTINAVVCLIHLAIFWLFCDLVFFIIKKIRKRKFEHYWAGLSAIALTTVYLAIGWILVHNVWQTNYVVETDKDIGELRIVQFADSHVGTTFSGKGLEKYVDEINRQKPDVVLICGDFVDDDTSKEDMQDACRALGRLEAEYGVYFVFGNHDMGYYGNSYRGYSGEELISELEKNNAHVLMDETVLVDDRFYIIGRKDMSMVQRADMNALVSELDRDRYTIVMDHQPCDYDSQAVAGVDMVLSGHTHGGQLIPINLIGEIISENDATYGLEKRNDTNFIVTSGISDWALKFKTGCRSEYIVIDVKGK